MKALFLAICMMISSCALAQGIVQTTPEERATVITQKLQQELALDEDQTAKLKQATTRRIAKMDALKSKESVKKEEVQAVIVEYEATAKLFLKPTQYKKFLESEHRSTEEKAEKQTQALSKSLKLSSEQTDKVRELVLKRIEKTDAIIERTKTNGKNEGESLEVVLKDYNDKLKGILTEKQFEKYQKLTPKKSL